MNRRDLDAEAAALAARCLALDPDEVERAVREGLALLACASGASAAQLWVQSGDVTGDTIRCRWSEEMWSRRTIAAVELEPARREIAADRHVDAGAGDCPGLRALLEEDEACDGLWIVGAESAQLGLLWLEGAEPIADSDRVEGLRSIAVLLAAALRRQLQERRTREARDQYRGLAENATELFAELDAAGRYLYVSPSYRDLLGYEPEQLLGTRSTRLLHPEDERRSKERFVRSLDFASLPAGGSEAWSVSTHRLLHADGRWRWFENSGRAFRRPDGEARFVTLGRDVTARLEMEEDLQRRQAFERRIAELSSRIFMLGGDQIERAVREGLADAARIARAERGILWVGESRNGSPARDFRWLAEGATLQATELPDWLHGRMRDGATVAIGSAAELPAEATAEREYLSRAGSQSLLAIPVRFENETLGAIAFEACEARVWSDADQRMLRLVGELLVSALRRKAAEDALLASRSQLLQAQKMEAVGRLAGGIAHDFNNLLTVILGFSRAMLREMPVDHTLRTDTLEIEAAAERAAVLTRQLLTFSRRQHLEVQVFDANEVVQGLRPMLERLLGEQYRLEADLHATPQMVEVDRHQLEQVLLNLVTNARDAMPEGGRIRIRTRPAEREDGERSVRLSVLDSGMGMDEETLAQVFDPFFTTKEQGKGTGLGLSIAYSIVEQFGGRLHFERNAERGMSCHATLPWVDPDEAAARSRPIERPRPPLGEVEGSAVARRILVAEDQYAVRRLLVRILESEGFEIVEAVDGVEALARVDACEIDLLVSDVAMPNMTGPELAEKLREQRPDLPVLFLSGYPMGPRVGRDGRPDEGAFLAKPFERDALVAAVRGLLKPD